MQELQIVLCFSFVLLFVGLVVAPVLAGIFPAPPLEKWSEDQNEK